MTKLIDDKTKDKQNILKYNKLNIAEINNNQYEILFGKCSGLTEVSKAFEPNNEINKIFKPFFDLDNKNSSINKMLGIGSGWSKYSELFQVKNSGNSEFTKVFEQNNKINKMLTPALKLDNENSSMNKMLGISSGWSKYSELFQVKNSGNSEFTKIFERSNKINKMLMPALKLDNENSSMNKMLGISSGWSKYSELLQEKNNKIVAMTKAFKQSSEINQMFKSALELNNENSQMNKMLDLNEYSKLLQGKTSGISSMSIAFERSNEVSKMIKPLLKVPKIKTEILEGNNSLYNNSLFETIDLYGDTLAIQRDTDVDDLFQDVNYEEFEMGVDEVTNILSDNSLTLQQKLFTIWEKFKSENIILIVIVWTFILSPILTPLKEEYDEWMYESVSNIVRSVKDGFIYTDCKQLNKSIKKEITKEINQSEDIDKNDILNTYRFVNCDSLNIRYKNTTNSAVIYSLNRGDVVKIINKQKNWTKIEYKNEDETVVITGWVFTRYISRFN